MVAGLLGALCIAVLLFLQRSDFTAPSDRTRTKQLPGGDSGSLGADMPRSSPLPSKPETRETAGSQTQAFGTVQRALQSSFRTEEAQRAKLLSTTKHGSETWHLFGVEPPSSTEVKKARAMIARLQKQVAPEKREKFDAYLEHMIKLYDPFGTGGRKGIIIKIPDDLTKGIKGISFSTNNFDEDIKRFDPKNGENHTFENYRGYTGTDKIPERFEALIITEEVEDK